jgi:hypothetical protein
LNTERSALSAIREHPVDDDLLRKRGLTALWRTAAVLTKIG